jgi:hypothetical protein
MHGVYPLSFSSSENAASSIMVIALVGHSSAQIPHPLQYSRSIIGGIVRVMTISGQKSQHMKQASAFLLQGMQRLLSNTGRSTRQEPVLPPSPAPGSLWEVFLL